MKISKAFVSITSAAALTISAVAMAAVASATSTKINDPSVKFDDKNVVVTFGAFSDIHLFDYATDHDTYFTNVLQKFVGLAGGKDKLNALMIAGDLAENKPLETYPRIKNMLDANISVDATEVIPAIGNHDSFFEDAFSGINSFKDKLGSYVYKKPVSYNTADDVIRGNYHTVINGIHFLSVRGVDGNHATKDLTWLDSQLKKASDENPFMPIFIDTHVIPYNTVYGSDDDSDNGRWFSTTIGPVLEKYPQAVIFAGHTHYSAHEDNSVWRGAYTAVGTGSTSDDSGQYDARDADLVQVDKNGVVRIRSYSSKDNDPNSKPLNEWVFANMPPKFNPPLNDEIIASTQPNADVLDVDFADGTAKDKASSIEGKTMGSAAKISDNTAVGKKAAEFDGSGALGYTFANTQYDKLKNTTTLACTFNLKEAPSSGYVDVFGNMAQAGQGFEYTSEKVLQYYLCVGGSYVICEAQNIEPQKWINAVGTYDNKEVRLYINGELVDRKPATGDIKHPASPANVYCVGADVKYDGNYENGAKVLISSAKVFSKPLNATQAYVLFSKENNTKLAIPGEDMYKAVEGVEYTFPTVTATDANGSVPVTFKLQSPNGTFLNMKDKFTPGTVGEYKFTYRANGLIKTQVVKVSDFKMLDQHTVSLEEGANITLKASVNLEDDAVSKWESSDNSVATVDANGKVTAVKAGTAVIKVESTFGLKDSCTVTVTAKGQVTTTTGTDTTNSTTNTTIDTTTDNTTASESVSSTNSTSTDDGSPKTSDGHSAMPYLLIVMSIFATGVLFISKKMNQVKSK